MNAKELVMVQTFRLERRVADVIRQLPPTPESVNALLAAAVACDECTPDVLELIKNDPGLCVELLRLANSSCYRGPEAAETAEEAIDCVGVWGLAQLVGTEFARESIQREFASHADVEGYLAHSRDISQSARILAKLSGLAPHEQEVYTVAGLIHDIGRLIMMVAAGPTGAPLAGTTWRQMHTIVADEQEAMGMDHCEVGMRVCRKWRLTPFLQEMVLRHHTPLLDDDFSFAGSLVFVSHFVSASDFTGETLSALLPKEVLANLNLTPDDIDHAQAMYRAEA
jgi:HD-like signal output (HDOD) protein